MDGITVVAKRPRRSEAVFRKDVFTDANLALLRIHAAGVSARSCMGCKSHQHD